MRRHVIDHERSATRSFNSRRNLRLYHSFAPLREISTTTSRPAATLEQRLTDKLGLERLTLSWTFQAGERDEGCRFRRRVLTLQRHDATRVCLSLLAAILLLKINLYSRGTRAGALDQRRETTRPLAESRWFSVI